MNKTPLKFISWVIVGIVVGKYVVKVIKPK